MKAAKARRLSVFSCINVARIGSTPGMKPNPIGRFFNFILRDRWLAGVMAMAAVLGLIYNGVIVVGLGVDETRHMNYVQLLHDERQLPHLVPGSVPDAQGHEVEYAGAHTYHPPLYYLTLLPFYALLQFLPHEALWHILRGVSLLLCLAALPCIYDIALRATRGSVVAARLAVAQVALLPMWAMMASTITNDAMVFLMVTVFLWLLIVHYPQNKSLKSAVVIGVVFGLCVVSKGNAIPANAIALLIYFLWQYRSAWWKNGRMWLRAAIVAIFALLVSAPWLLYNLAQYGSAMHTPPPMPSPALPAPSNGILVMMLHENFPQHLWLANRGIFETLWSQKDWIPEAVRPAVYGALSIYCGFALLGFVGACLAKSNSKQDIIRDFTPQLAIGATLAAFAVSWLVVLTVALFVHWGWAEGGRYLFPVLSGLSIFLACGWRHILKEARLNFFLIFWCIAMLALNATCVYWLLTYLNPRFASGI
jgi:4-amino-4-deoxy-L-arabinose transferase-like glycosyltransferase